MYDVGCTMYDEGVAVMRPFIVFLAKGKKVKW